MCALSENTNFNTIRCWPCRILRVGCIGEIIMTTLCSGLDTAPSVFWLKNTHLLDGTVLARYRDPVDIRCSSTSQKPIELQLGCQCP